jgi:hypothetical protein
MLPTRPSRNSGRAKLSRECQSHRKWVRGFACSSCGKKPGDEFNPIEAAHVRLGTGGGTGLLPSDRWLVSLCRDCHRKRPDSQHSRGERTFWRRLGIAEPKTLAAEFARKSPHWPKLRDMP